MTDLTARFSLWAGAWFTPLLADALVKATLVLAAAWLAAGLLRAASAAHRHRLWCVALAGLLLLPVLSASLPAWQLAILPPPAPMAAESTADLAWDLPAAEAWAESEELAGTIPGAAARPNAREHRQPASDVAAMELINTVQPAAPPVARSISLASLMPILWLAGMAAVLLPLAVALRRTRRLLRTAEPIEDARLARLVAEVAGSLGLRGAVRIFQTRENVVPMACRLLRATVLLPAAWRQWSPQRQRVVLLHELAHVKRHDVALQVLARVAAAVYWLHPLAWYALRRIRVERELACDDCVLTAGERPSEYARELLEIARTCRIPRLHTAVAMAQSTRLERRVRGLLDPRRSHRPMGAAAGWTLLVLAASFITAVALLQPATLSQAEAPAAEEPEAKGVDHFGESVVLAFDRDSIQAALSRPLDPNASSVFYPITDEPTVNSWMLLSYLGIDGDNRLSFYLDFRAHAPSEDRIRVTVEVTDVEKNRIVLLDEDRVNDQIRFGYAFRSGGRHLLRVDMPEKIALPTDWSKVDSLILRFEYHEAPTDSTDRPTRQRNV